MESSPSSKLIEPAELQTVWVTDCVAVGLVGGILVISLAEQRFDLSDGEAASHQVERHVVARLAMTPGSFREMVARAARVETAAAQASAPPPTDALN